MPLFRKGDAVGEGLNLQRWRVVRPAGTGQFAEVFEVVDTFKQDRKFALKVEKTLEVKTVKQEQKVLRRLQPCPCVVRLVEAGTHEQRNFIVMELLGMNVADMRKSCAPGGRWDARTTAAIGRHMLDAIAGMHQLGFIHRDIKPANFAITPRFEVPAKGAWHVIDFGLARRYVDDAGMVLPARPEAAFRGSTTYASLAAHDGEDLGRRDDLWSWLYVLVEMLTGTLPWRCEEGTTRDAARDRETAVRMKRECLGVPEQLSVSSPLPKPLVRISQHLEGLLFQSDPDYAALRRCLDDLASMDPETAALNGLAARSAAEEAALAALADTPLSPPDIADTPLSPPAAPVHVMADAPLSPPDIADTPLSPPADTPLSPPGDDEETGLVPRLPFLLLQQVQLPLRPADSLSVPLHRPAPLDSTRILFHMQSGKELSRRVDDAPSSTAAEPRNGAATLNRSPSRGNGLRRSSSSPRSRSHSRSRSASQQRYSARSPARGRSPRDRYADRRRDGRDSLHGGRPDVYDRRRDASREAEAVSDRDRLSERERRGEFVRDSDRGRYKRESVSARRDDDRCDDRRDERQDERRDDRRGDRRDDRREDDDRRPAHRDGGAGPGREAAVDTARCRHIGTYLTRAQENKMSEDALDCKALLKRVKLTEGLGLAAYVIDKGVAEVSTLDADQMASLVGELEEFCYQQRLRARNRAKQRR